MADALSKVHVRVLRLSIDRQYQQLIMVIQPKYELEELSIQLPSNRMANKFLIALTEVIVDYSLTKTTNTSFDTRTIPKLPIATDHGLERRVICPNLKVLDLWFWDVRDKKRGEVRQWCVQMMEGRGRAGCPLDRCRIWWYMDNSGKGPSQVLFTSNEGIIMDE